MSVDHTVTTTETETSMFPEIPSWERGKKRRRFGAARDIDADIQHAGLGSDRHNVPDLSGKVIGLAKPLRRGT